MKFTILALNLSVAASASMAEVFVRSMNSNTSAPVESAPTQNAKNRGVKKNTRRVLRGKSRVIDVAAAERELKEDDKDNKYEYRKYVGYNSGLNYFVPNYDDRHNGNSKFDSRDFNADEFNYNTRPSTPYDIYYGEPKFKDNSEAWQSDKDKYSYGDKSSKDKYSYGDKSKDKYSYYDDKSKDKYTYDDKAKKDKYKYKDEDYKANAEEVNYSFEEETDAAFVETAEPTEPPTLVPTPTPSELPTPEPSELLTQTPTLEPISKVVTGNPTFDEIESGIPTFTPTLNPSVSAAAVSEESATPTFSPSLEPTATQEEASFAVATGHPTIPEPAPDSEAENDMPTFSPTLSPSTTPEEASFAAATGNPTIDETGVPTGAGNETSTKSSIWSFSTTAWDVEVRPSSWGEEKPERTRAPKNETSDANSLSPPPPTPAPTLIGTSAMIASSGTPTVSFQTPFPSANLPSAVTSPAAPTKWPTYSPTSRTYSPAFSIENATTTIAAMASGTASTVIYSTSATSSRSVCTIDFCAYELSTDYLMEYTLNVPEGTNEEECDLCSVTIRLTYDGEVSWLGLAFSRDGQMVGSEAVIGNFMSGDEPGKYNLGGKYDGAILPMEDSKQTLIDASIVVEDGQTVMTFTKQLKEDGEIELFSGDNTFLWAHGDAKSASTYHGNNKGAFQLNLLGNS